MITIHSVEEMLNFYSLLGGVRQETVNGFCYVFPKQRSKVRFWGNLRNFSVADADFVYPHDTIIRSQFSRFRRCSVFLRQEKAFRRVESCNRIHIRLAFHSRPLHARTLPVPRAASAACCLHQLRRQATYQHVHVLERNNACELHCSILLQQTA